MEGFLGSILYRVWLKPNSLIVLLLLNILLIATTLPQGENPTCLLFILLSLCCLALDIFYIVGVVDHNKYPRAKDRDTAVLFIIDAESIKQFEDTKRKMVDSFSYAINMSTDISFKVLYLKYHKVNKIDMSMVKNQRLVLEKTNCRYLIHVRVICDDIDDENQYEMTINTGIIHRSYADDIQKKFISVFNSIVSLYAETQQYLKSEKIQIIKAKTDQMVNVCKYIFGITHYLEGDLKQSLIIFRDLYEVIRLSKRNEPVRNKLKSILPTRCYEVYYISALQEYEMYKNTKDKKHLELMSFNLNKANDNIPETYDYYLLMAVFHVLFNRAITKAIDCIKNCKRILPNGNWKYSQAFILAYEGRSPLLVYRHYKAAFRIDYNIVELIVFIEEILETETDRNVLRFALGLLYEKIDDKELMHTCFMEFITNADKEEINADVRKFICEKYPLFDLPTSYSVELIQS